MIHYPTISDAATQARTEKCFELFKDHYYSPALLADAIAQAIILLGKGICLDAFDDHNSTFLHRMAREGHIEIVKLLLGKNANIEARDKNGNTSLLSATGMGRNKIIKLLLTRGADIEARDDRSSTSLHRVARYRNTEGIKLLLAYGADSEARDDTGNTPLHYVIEKDDTESMAPLLAKGANVYVMDKNGLSYGNSTVIDYHLNTCLPLHSEFVESRTSPKSAEKVYQLLSVWPLPNPKIPVDRAAHLRQIFSHANWQTPQQATDIIAQLQERGENLHLCASLLAMVQRPHLSRLTCPTARNR